MTVESQPRFDTAAVGYHLDEGAPVLQLLNAHAQMQLNWLIDVPMLLIQILFVAEITGAARSRYMIRFSTSGALMIILGYIGQFYEPGRLNENIFLWAFWGIVSTLFFIHVLVLITQVIREGKSHMEGTPKKIFGAILPLFYISWWLYPIAYASAGLSERLTEWFE